MTLKNLTVIAAAALLALASCSGNKTGFPKIDQKGKTAIVAHRGYWNCEAAGFSENSIASLKAAQDNGLWGSECDVHITTDDVVLVFHDNKINGERIDTCASTHFADYRLPNGETIPTIDEYLTQVEKCDKTILVLELKEEITMDREDLLVDKCIEALEAHNLLDPKRVVFISFSKYMCDRIAAEFPEFVNQYLEGDFSPEELAADGINGFDYEKKVIKKDSTIVARAHELGMSTNVWTVNKPEQMQYFIDLGINAITTNEPMVLRELLGDKEFKL
ncbi:MAG: glycerophosphodiester phosphodiesterase [Bacteroidales bacterium]|nr:glycerophosphodiester phosphodiesterase [Bacteroidales bacterium]